MKLEFRKEISAMTLSSEMVIPKWYGIAYVRADRFVYVLYPILINKLVGYWRKLYTWLYSPTNNVETRAYSKGHGEGFANGYEIGRRRGYDAGYYRGRKDVIKGLEAIQKGLKKYKLVSS